MNDQEAPPRQFANHVIRQMATHMLADDIVVELNDYLAIRSVFRSCKGSWVEITQGNIAHLELLKHIVTAWGNMPGRKHSNDEVV